MMEGFDINNWDIQEIQLAQLEPGGPKLHNRDT